MARKSTSQQRAAKQAEAEARRKKEAQQRNIRAVAVGGGLLLVVALLLVVLWPEPSTGDTTAEAWDLPQLDGEGRVALADFAGKPTVAAFFASWCEVCEEEMPQMFALSQQIGDEVNFVGINSQDNGRGLGDAEKWGIAGEWPLARDIGNGNGSSLSVQTFNARGSPTNVIYDAQGNVVHVQLGGLTPAQVVELLDELTEYEA